MSLKFESQFQRGILSFIEKISCELWTVTRILKFEHVIVWMGNV